MTEGPDPAEATDPPAPSLWRRTVWLWATLAAGVLSVLTVVVLPPERSIDNIAEWAFRIAPLVLAVFAAAYFPRRPGMNLVLLVLVVLGYMGVFDTFIIRRILEYAHTPDAHMPEAFPKLYQMTILLAAFVLIVVCFAYRLGGAKPYKVVRLGLAGVFIVTSGLNDLTYFFTHDWPGGRPAVMDAPHIAVFVGGNPTPATAIAFCAVNLLIAAAIIVVPWYLVRRRGSGAGTAQRPADTDGSPQLGH